MEPPASRVPATTTIVPGVSFWVVASSTVTGTSGGTVMVCEPPLYVTVTVPLAAPLLVPFVMRAAPLVIRADPFVIREPETLPLVIVLLLPPDGAAIGLLPSPNPRRSSGNTWISVAR